MAVKFRIDNPDLISEEQTYLTEDYSSGVNISVRNNEGFTTQFFVVVGDSGQEQTETKDISSLSGNQIIVISSTLKFSHPKSTPVYLTEWDRVYVERASSSAGSYSVITNSETGNGYWDIEWDDRELSTLILDNSGSTAHYYRWRFRNSVTGTYSSYSGILPGGGLERNQAGFIIEKVRKNPITKGVDDDTMYAYMTDLQDLVYEEVPKAWWFSKEGTEVATTADTYRYSISTNWSDLLSVKYMLYRYVSGSTDNIYPLTFITDVEFYNYKTDTNQNSSDNVTKWTFLPPDTSSAKGYIGIHTTPDTATCYLKPVYYFELSDITSFDDTLVVPRPKAYEDYILYRIYDDIKSDGDNAEKYNRRVQSSIVALKKRAKRQLGQRELFRYRGQRGFSQMFGEHGYMSSDDRRESFW